MPCLTRDFLGENTDNLVWNFPQWLFTQAHQSARLSAGEVLSWLEMRGKRQHMIQKWFCGNCWASFTTHWEWQTRPLTALSWVLRASVNIHYSGDRESNQHTGQQKGQNLPSTHTHTYSHRSSRCSKMISDTFVHRLTCWSFTRELSGKPQTPNCRLFWHPHPRRSSFMTSQQHYKLLRLRFQGYNLWNSETDESISDSLRQHSCLKKDTGKHQHSLML